MSEENVEMVRRVYGAINRQDWDAMFRDMHPEFEMTTQRGPIAGTYRGREGVTRFVEDYIATFDEFAVDPGEFFEGRDQVVALVTLRSRPRGGSVDLMIRNGHLWTIRRGSIRSLKTFPEPERALQAAGLAD